jgi:hypothetical protein
LQLRYFELKYLYKLISFRKIIILVLVAGITFALSNFWLKSILNNENFLSKELKSPTDSIYSWTIGTQAPFKYRALHRIIVLSTYNLIKGKNENNDTFILIYQVESILFHFLAIFLFYLFLVKINLSEYALTGALLFALLPPLLMAYKLPVHTREDTLAYCILILGLMAILGNHFFQILLFAILGVLCRETLLLIPFVNLFYNRKQSLYARLLIALLAFVTFLLLRFSFGTEKYDYWEGLRWNLNNMVQVIGFGYLSFGFLWITFFWSCLRKKEEGRMNDIIYRSRIPVSILVLVTTFVGGIFNEIRLLYLLAPWIIPIGLHFYNNHKIAIRSLIKSRGFQIYAILLLILFTGGTIFLLSIVVKILASKYEISLSTWVVAASIHIYLGMLCIPYFYQLIKKEYFARENSLIKK